jgi:hypothetical protein
LEVEFTCSPRLITTIPGYSGQPEESKIRQTQPSLAGTGAELGKKVIIGGSTKTLIPTLYPVCLHQQSNFQIKSTSTIINENQQSTTQNSKNLQLQKPTN